MLKVHVKLLSTSVLIALRDMEVGMVYKGNKGLPKLVVHKTKKAAIIRNLGEERTVAVSFDAPSRGQNKCGTLPRKVFAIAKNDQRDIDKLVNKTQTV